MGLDMYLEKVIEEDGCYCIDLVCEWGKSSGIFRWFNRNVCGGRIEGGKYYDVSREQLEDLAKDCGMVVEDHSIASEVMPTMKGHGRLGRPEYDRWYFLDAERTRDSILEALESDGDNVTYTFYASW